MAPSQKVAGHGQNRSAVRAAAGVTGSNRDLPATMGLRGTPRYSAGWHAPCGRGAGPPRRRRRREKKITAAPISGR